MVLAVILIVGSGAQEVSKVKNISMWPNVLVIFWQIICLIPAFVQKHLYKAKWKRYGLRILAGENFR